jgi:hypothetical protein
MIRTGPALIFLVSSFAALASIRGAVKWASPSPPRLELPAEALDLGNVGPDQIARGSFSLRNRGGQPLDYKLRPSCGCSELYPTQGTLKPGDHQEVRVGVRHTERGIKKHVAINVSCNDPASPSVSFGVLASFPEIMSVEPPKIDLGMFGPGQESPHATVKIADFDGKPFTAPELVGVESAEPYVKFTREAKDGLVWLDVFVCDELPVGQRLAKLHVVHPASREGIDVLVLVDRTERLRIIPSYIALDWSRKGEATFFVARTDGQSLPELEATEATPGLVVEEVAPHAANRRRFALRVKPHAEISGPAGFVRLKFRGLSDSPEARVVLSGGVRP